MDDPKKERLKRKIRKKILFCLEKEPYPIDKLSKQLSIKKSDAGLFHDAIKELIQEKEIKKTKGMLSKKRDSKRLVIGKLSMHPRGFGFVTPDRSLKMRDIFIPKPFTNGAVDGDEVEVELSAKMSSKGPEGKITQILKRARSTVAGTILYRENGTFRLFCPLFGADKRVYLEHDKKDHLKTGDRVIMKVSSWGDEVKGTLHKHLGHILDPSIDIACASEEFEIRHEFPEKALKELEAYPDEVEKKADPNRKDLTDLTTITIDPDTARDFDDALSIYKDKEGNFELYVHIADVAHYVKEGSALDIEAYQRANSTYFPGNCVPMLPEKLSNGLCSLKPDVIRATATVYMRFDPKGDLVKHEIYRSYIKSQKRFTYEEAFELLEKGKKAPFLKELILMRDLALLLKEKRRERGSIDFALPEAKIVVDKKGEPLKIQLIHYDITHQLVEEFMLKANEMVATDLKQRGEKLIYRIHEEPKEESFEDFFSLARTLGFHLPQKPEAKDLQRLFKEAKETPFIERLSVAFIRSMKLACYSEQNVGHYGLQLENYTHFTSPIRRYSDLIIQRLLFGEGSKNRNLEKIAKEISERERISMKAEGSVTLLKKLRLLKKDYEKDRTKTYSATISKVKPFALFFELSNFYLEGSIHISEIGDDFYHYDQKKNRFVGERNRRIITFGDSVEVRIVEIDLITGTVVYEFIPKPGQERKKKPSRKQKRKR